MMRMSSSSSGCGVSAMGWRKIVVFLVLSCVLRNNQHYQALGQEVSEEFDIDTFLENPKPAGHPLEHVVPVPEIDALSLTQMQASRNIDYIMVMMGNMEMQQHLSVEVFWARVHTYMGRGWKIDCIAAAYDEGSDQNQICGYLTTLFPLTQLSNPGFIKWTGHQFEVYSGEQSYHSVHEWLHQLPGGADIFKHDLVQNNMESSMLEPQMHVSDEGNEVAVLMKMIKEASPNAQFVEWGTGGSTHMVANLLKGKQRYFAIEHVETWCERVKRGLPPTRDEAKISVHCIAPEVPEFGFDENLVRPNGHSREELPLGLDHYINLDNVPGLNWNAVEGVLVDGVARGAVLMMLAANLNEGTTVMLHDYNGRSSSYDWALHGYERVKTEYSTLVLRVKKQKCKASNDLNQSKMS